MPDQHFVPSSCDSFTRGLFPLCTLTWEGWTLPSGKGAATGITPQASHHELATRAAGPRLPPACWWLTGLEAGGCRAVAGSLDPQPRSRGKREKKLCGCPQGAHRHEPRLSRVRDSGCQATNAQVEFRLIHLQPQKKKGVIQPNQTKLAKT